MNSLVEVSARHLHLLALDYKVLFGDEEMPKIKELSQKDYTTGKFVTIVGPKRKIDRVQLLGPFRDYSQVEISKTDAISLGVPAPLKISGDLPGTKVKIFGPKGTIEKPIAIIAKRHIHLSPEEAEQLNLDNNQTVKFKIKSGRSLVFDDVVVRVADNYSNTIHLDTDEGNAAGIEGKAEGELIFQ